MPRPRPDSRGVPACRLGVRPGGQQHALPLGGQADEPLGVDQAGRTAIDWGVYGVPETFVVGRKGDIIYKHVGPLTPDAVTANLMPAVEKALADIP